MICGEITKKLVSLNGVSGLSYERERLTNSPLFRRQTKIIASGPPEAGAVSAPRALCMAFCAELALRRLTLIKLRVEALRGETR